MKSNSVIVSGALCILVFGSLAVYLGWGWCQNFLPEAEATNFVFLIFFTAIGLLAFAIGLAMLWELIKRVLSQSNKQ
ncbi:MAG: hypothetical protein JW869_02270 [Candidatus Omnitrophica bacterium]|nr:hypothetical protein [Candidatus Omnitrophota bacterium]